MFERIKEMWRWGGIYWTSLVGMSDIQLVKWFTSDNVWHLSTVQTIHVVKGGIWRYSAIYFRCKSACLSNAYKPSPFFLPSFSQTESVALQCPRPLLSTLKLDRYSHLPPFEDRGMKQVEIITSVHQTHPREENGEEGGMGEGGRGKGAMRWTVQDRGNRGSRKGSCSLVPER